MLREMNKETDSSRAGSRVRVDVWKIFFVCVCVCFDQFNVLMLKMGSFAHNTMQTRALCTFSARCHFRCRLARLTPKKNFQGRINASFIPFNFSPRRPDRVISCTNPFDGV